MCNINAKTKQLAIIGDPVEHSKSPVMHQIFAKLTGKNYIYTAFRVEKENLEDAIKGIRALGIKGINVTAPHKIEVMKYLDEISPDAKLYNSVNTIVNDGTKLIGYNTDADGFYNSLLMNNIDVHARDILIFGAGGASGPVIIKLAKSGARSVTVINRTQKKAEDLKDYVFDRTGFLIETQIKNKRYDVVVNTTSAGMYPQTDKIAYEDLSFIDKDTAVVDMIYNPETTRFLKIARQKGAKTLNGLGMLICQGMLSYELFTGTTLPENAYEEAKKAVI